MSYLETRISRKEFIETRGAKNTQANANNSLRLFDYFCTHQFQKDGDEIILEIQQAIEKDNNFERMFRLCNSFVKWLSEAHPDVKITYNRWTSHVKKHHPSSIRLQLGFLRQYLEEYGQLEFSERRFQRVVKLPRQIEEEPEPFTKDEIRSFIEAVTPKRRALYMMLKDSAMRIGEAVQLRKRDIDLTTNPVTITIQANYTKTKKGRTTHVTRETRKFIEKILENKRDDEIIFGSNAGVKQSVNNEIRIFARARERIKENARYESNGRFKKNLHSLRAYCATQLAEIYGEEFAHGFIGHKGYLKQYIRNKDKLAEKYLRAENQLMIYETVEVVENSISSEMIKERIREEMKKQFGQLHELEVRREQLLIS